MTSIESTLSTVRTSATGGKLPPMLPDGLAAIFRRALATSAIFISFITTPVVAEELQITTGEFAPLYSKNFTHFGVIPHIVKEALEAAGISAEFSSYPWARAAHMVKKGNADATCCWFDKSERREYAYYSDPVFPYNYAFFHLKSYPFDWSTLEDLKGIKIGGTFEYTYTKEFVDAEHAKTIHVERVASDLQNFKRLLRGRIDIFPMNTIAGYQLLAKEFTPNEAESLTHHPKLFFHKPVHLLFSKQIEGSERIVKLFNQGLKSLHDSGRYKQILQQFDAGYYVEQTSK